MNSAEKDNRVAQIRSIWRAKETENLLEVWRENDRDAWTDETFDAIESILQERLGEIPPQSSQVVAATSLSLGPDVVQRLKQARHDFDADKCEEALAAFDDVIRLAPDFASAHLERGLVLDEMGRLEEAIAAYQEAVRLDPQLEDARLNLRDAQNELEETFDVSPIREQLQQAMVDAAAGELEKALAECEQVLLTSPHLATVHDSRGMILEEMGRLDDAIAAYETAIQLNPELYAARDHLSAAKLKWEARQYQRARDECLEAGENRFEGYTQADFDALPDEGEIPACFYLDEKALLLRGAPGHRILPGRSGYDPLDGNFEQAYMQGVLIRSIFARKLRTGEPLYWVMMLVHSCLLVLPIPLGITSILYGEFGLGLAWLVAYIHYWVIGLALLVNLILSIVDEMPPTADGKVFY